MKALAVIKMLEEKHSLFLLFMCSLIGFEFVQSTCSGGCTSCTHDTCVTCNVGSYLESGSCHTCPVQCTSCNNYEVCYTCVEGYFGLSCDEKCNELCLNKACNKDSGICTDGCREGYFDSGSLCSKCDVNCKKCTQTSINCLECKDGNYGPTCQYSCSHCTDGICTKDNCTYGCVDGFVIGRETCNKCSVDCTSCTDTFDNCHSCVDGYYGPACQYQCTECSHCNKDDGSCLTTEKVYPPTITTQMTSPSKESTTSLLTTKIFETTSNNTSPHSAINTGSKFQEQNQEDPPLDDTTIISAAVGGGGGLVFIVIAVIVLFVCKRRSETKQTNEHVCQVRELDVVSQDYTTLEIETREEDGHLYWSLNKADTKVTIEARSTNHDPSGKKRHHDMQQTHIAGTRRGTYVNVF